MICSKLIAGNERIDATAEKAARASLFSAVTRQLSPDRIVIFDGMNYIKGFRYQLYCAAREYKCRTCTVSPSSRKRHQT